MGWMSGASERSSLVRARTTVGWVMARAMDLGFKVVRPLCGEGSAGKDSLHLINIHLVLFDG